MRPAFLAFVMLASACATAPAPAGPVISFETKMSWILRLEDQRILREAVPIPAPQVVTRGRKPALPPAPPPADLLRLLTDSEARIRRRAAIAIGRVGLPDGIGGLVKLLEGDPDPEVRQMSAFALGLIGDNAAVEPLRRALDDPLPLVAGRAAEALGLIGDAESAAAIGSLAGRHVGEAAAVAIDESAVQLTPQVDAFRLAVYALARLKAYEPLAAAVLASDGQPRVRWWPVAYAFQRMEDRRALAALLAFARSEGSYARAFAAKGLGALKDPAAVPTLLQMIDPARADSGPVIEAVRALGRIGSDEAVPVLTKLLNARELTPTMRADVVLALSETPSGGNPDRIVDLLADSNPVIRAAALRAASKWDDGAFMTVLSGLDPDPHWSVRAELATILATKDPERALPRLLDLLGDADARVIPSVLTALTKLKAPDIGKVLIERLAHDDVGVRAAAAENLGEVRPEGGVEALLSAYKRGQADLVYDTRTSALEALSKYGPTVAVPPLQTALSDKDWAVRVKAAELLKQLDPAVETAPAMRPAPAGRAISYELPSLLNPTVSPHVFLETAKGIIEIELDVLDAPQTCENFMALARRGYFDGLAFHRVIPNFVIQDGDPRGTGEGGPGYSIRDELNQEPYIRGTVGMALAWRDTGGSQFFITHSPQPHLDARYTVFGRVVSGMDVVDRISQWDVIMRVRVWDGGNTGDERGVRPL